MHKIKAKDLEELLAEIRMWYGWSVASELRISDHGMCTEKCPLFEWEDLKRREARCNGGGPPNPSPGGPCYGEFTETIEDVIRSWGGEFESRIYWMERYAKGTQSEGKFAKILQRRNKRYEKPFPD